MASLEIRQEDGRVIIPLELWRHITKSLGLPEDLQEASRKLLKFKERAKKGANWRKLRGFLERTSTQDLEEEHRWEIEHEREKFGL